MLCAAQAARIKPKHGPRQAIAFAARGGQTFAGGVRAMAGGR